MFLDAIIGFIDPNYAHFNKRCISVTQPPPDSDPNARSTVHFSDGTSVEADVVLLANGVKGGGREAVTGRDPKEDIVFSNVICYRGLVTVEEARKAGVKTDLSMRPACFMGVGKVREVYCRM